MESKRKRVVLRSVICGMFAVIALRVTASAAESPVVPLPDGYRSWQHVKSVVSRLEHKSSADEGGKRSLSSMPTHKRSMDIARGDSQWFDNRSRDSAGDRGRGRVQRHPQRGRAQCAGCHGEGRWAVQRDGGLGIREIR